MEKKLITGIRVVNRVLSSALVLLFLVFFIGESIGSEGVPLKAAEILMILFVPVMLSFGIILAWFKELFGGMIIIVAIIGYNIVAMIFEGHITLEMDFGLGIIFGIVYVFLGIFNKRMLE